MSNVKTLMTLSAYKRICQAFARNTKYYFNNIFPHPSRFSFVIKIKFFYCYSSHLADKIYENKEQREYFTS